MKKTNKNMNSKILDYRNHQTNINNSNELVFALYINRVKIECD